jgi:hypothetical protein
MMKQRTRSRIRGAVALAAVLIVAPTGARAGEWIADAKSGCQVWNPSPQLEETVSWSGGCSNGRAEGPGTVEWLKGGVAIETDSGAWHDGRQAGQGSQIWASGRYQGDVADGEPNGRGVLTLQKLRYEGEFRDGKPNGSGRLTAGSDSVQGIWKDGCLQGERKASVGVPLSACR